MALTLVGGYDPRVDENVQHYKELVDLAKSLKLTVTEFPDMSGDVRTLRSGTDQQLAEMLEESWCLLYTPENEHFGIVPLEAMLKGRPVIACPSGGPLETVLHGTTGFHCQPNSSEWADAMGQVAAGRERAEALGTRGRERVLTNFSNRQFGDELHAILVDLMSKKRGDTGFYAVFWILLVCGLVILEQFGFGFGFYAYKRRKNWNMF